MSLPKKKRKPLKPDNLFDELDSSHFEDSFLNGKGIKELIEKLKDKNSKLYNSFGEAGVELFYEYYFEHKNDRTKLTSIARDIIVANSILFNESPEGPDSSLVRQVDQLFSLIPERAILIELERLLIKLVIVEKNDLSLIPIYNAFIDLYIKSSSVHKIQFELLSHALSHILSLSRMKLAGLRELDRLYLSSLSNSKKIKIITDSAEYLSFLTRGTFSSPMSLIKFFNDRDYKVTALILQYNHKKDVDKLSYASNSFGDNYPDEYSKKEHLNEKLNHLHETIKKGLLRWKK